MSMVRQFKNHLEMSTAISPKKSMATGWDAATSKGKMSYFYVVLLTGTGLHSYSTDWIYN